MGALAFPTAARAADASSDLNPRPVIDFGFRFAILTSDSFVLPIAWDADLEATYHLTSAVRFGAYVATAQFTGTGDRFEKTSAVRFGARAELHPFPRSVVDPWLGATFGPFEATHNVASTGWGVDAAAEVGVDFHIGPVSIGPLFTAIMPLVNADLLRRRRLLHLVLPDGAPPRASLGR